MDIGEEEESQVLQDIQKMSEEDEELDENCDKQPGIPDSSLIHEVRFNKDGTFEFPETWNRKRKKRVGKKIKKKLKQGHVFKPFEEIEKLRKRKEQMNANE